MELYSSTEVAERLGVSLSTMFTWNNTKKFVAEERQNGYRKYTEEQVDNFIYDRERKTSDKKLVVLSLRQKIKYHDIKNFEVRFGSESDDKCFPVEIIGVPEEELLSNKDFKKLIRELVGHYIYRLVVFKSDFKEGSNAYDYLKMVCEETRTSLKFVEGEDEEEENEELNT